MRSFVARLVILSLVFVAGVSAGELFRDDFSRYPPRVFASPVKELTNAIQEYHYLAHRGVPLGPWDNAMIHDDAWAGGDEDGKPYVEMHVVNDQSATLQPDPDHRRPGVVRLHRGGEGPAAAAWTTSRASSSAITPTATTTCSRCTDGKKARPAPAAAHSRRRSASAEWRELGAAAFPYDTHALLHAEGGERGPAHARLHRRQAGARGQRRRDPQGQGRHHRQHSGALHRTSA